MRLRELLKLIDSNITLEIENVKEIYDKKSSIPKERMIDIVKSIKVDKNGILIILNESQKVKSLEELGYGFEMGM